MKKAILFVSLSLIASFSAYAEWANVDGGSGGSTTLTARYTNGHLVDRSVSVTVNGQSAGILTLGPSGAWVSWAEETITITLNAGIINAIRLTASESIGRPKLDHLEVEDQ